MSEYLIIVAMIAIAAIGVVSAFGETVQGHVSTMTQELAGNNVTSAFIASGAVRATASESSKTLADYASTN
ncbi:hypothetical protein JYT12_01130 [Beggiatoa alba]|nr:hypothetical protein [Beggiatoa alba]